MIRRQTGDGWFLITQNDHAILSAALAEHLGNQLFDKPVPKEPFVRGVSLHDCGWPLHDDEPTLNAAGEPLDVFETPREIGLKVWTASAERATAEDPYAGLLVSLHSLSLSVNATSPTAQKHEKFNLDDAAARFELNKFQHRQIELQESIRKRLGMRTDLPLRQGLAEDSSDPAEQRLVFHFRMLQAMDQLSLAICCTKPPGSQIKPVLARAGGRSLSLRVRRPNDTSLSVSPWPFDTDRIAVEMPYRKVSAASFPDEASFHAAYHSVPMEKLAITLSPSR